MERLEVNLHLVRLHPLVADMVAAGLMLLPQNLEEMEGLAVVVAVVVQLQTLAAQEIPHQLVQHKVVMVGVGFKDRLIMVLAVVEGQIKVQWLLAQQVPLLQAVMAALVLHLLFPVLQ
jgi:hypothetical protein